MKQRLEELKKEIALHNHRYYALDDPLISDAQYDALFKELLEIEAQHPEWVSDDSPSQRVGSVPVSGFETVQHRVPMLSLGNAFSEEELSAFDKRVTDALVKEGDRKSTRLNSSHVAISYAVFCLKKKKKIL